MDPLDQRAPERYLSVAQEAIHEIIIEKSRFIAYVTPVQDEASAMAFLDRIRQMHREATHVVYAYIIGAGGLLMRFSDDGEPQGTAGVPTLDVLKKQGLTDVLIATVRYFGGTKLGAGGLVRAYGRAASEGIAQAGVCEMVRQERLSVTVDYHFSGAISYWLKEVGWPAEVQYDQAVTYLLDVPACFKAPLLAQIAEKTGGQATYQWGELAYRPLPDIKL